MTRAIDAIPVDPSPPRAPARASSLSEHDLAELLTSFNEVTSKLQATHETLRAEVSRLQRELHDANEALRRSERLAALGEMAAGIAHEIRNPLAGIGLYARMLVTDLDDKPQCRDVAEKIARGVRGLDAIVGDVLTFARKIEPRSEPCDASELLSRVVETCLPQIQHANATVERADLSRRPIECACDASLVQQALVNVVRNAAEAMSEMAPASRPASPRLTIDAKRVRLRGRGGSSPMVCFSIEDNGPGIPDEVRARMFNPFFTTRHTGTGLGLAIVHRIVDAHAGLVRVKDASPGAIIEILLPDSSALDQGQAQHETERTE